MRLRRRRGRTGVSCPGLPGTKRGPSARPAAPDLLHHCVQPPHEYRQPLHELRLTGRSVRRRVHDHLVFWAGDTPPQAARAPALRTKRPGRRRPGRFPFRPHLERRRYPRYRLPRGACSPAVWRVDLRCAAHPLRPIHRDAPRYHTSVCIASGIHASESPGGQEECEWFLGERGQERQAPPRLSAARSTLQQCRGRLRSIPHAEYDRQMQAATARA